MRGTLEDRFWAKVDQRGLLDCWEWTGARMPSGYGQIQEGPAGGRVLYAHRVSLMLAGVPVEKTDLVLHNCDNKPCVNPAHLYVGTKADNYRDMVERTDYLTRWRPTVPRGEAHWRAKRRAAQAALTDG